MTQTRVDVNPHPGQAHVHRNAARFTVLSAGRRWGKTRLGVNECFDVASQGGRAWWVSPSYKTADVGWRPLRRLGGFVGAEIRRVDRRIVLPNGGEVTVRSADDPDSLRGEGLDLVVIDEAAHIRKFDVLWSQVLRASLSDRKGRALFISTPKGYNHFFELFQRAENSDDWAAFQYPTATNPFIDPGEIEAARLDLPELVFRQEYMAEFVQLAGAMFRREWFSTLEEAPTCKRWARFWDLAVSTKTTADYTVGAKVGLTNDGTLVIADVVRGRWEWPDAIKVIGQTAKSDGAKTWQGIEDVGMQKGMYQLLAREPSLVGYTFRPIRISNDKITRASPWLARAEQGKVAIVRGNWNHAFMDEICAFPEVKHDDQVDGVSGAVQMLTRAGVLFG